MRYDQIVLSEAMFGAIESKLPWFAALRDLAQSANDFAAFNQAVQRTSSGPYRPRSVADAFAMRKEGGSLATYDPQSVAEWFGSHSDPKYRTPVPPSGALTIYRATPDGEPIRPGDYVTESLRYAKDHINNNLGRGRISKLSATLDDLFPADGPHEFWYAPTVLDRYASLQSLYQALRQA